MFLIAGTPSITLVTSPTSVSVSFGSILNAVEYCATIVPQVNQTYASDYHAHYRMCRSTTLIKQDGLEPGTGYDVNGFTIDIWRQMSPLTATKRINIRASSESPRSTCLVQTNQPTVNYILVTDEEIYHFKKKNCNF